MPLSENEQKLLEQMERALYAEDPRFATHMKGVGSTGPSRKRIAIGVIAAVAGLGLVIAGVSTQLIVLGVIGFVVMVAGVAWAFTSGGKSSKEGDAGSAPSSPLKGGAKAARPTSARKRSRTRGAGGSGSFSQRMEDRWEKRRRENGGM